DWSSDVCSSDLFCGGALVSSKTVVRCCDSVSEFATQRARSFSGAHSPARWFNRALAPLAAESTTAGDLLPWHRSPDLQASGASRHDGGQRAAAISVG